MEQLASAAQGFVRNAEGPGFSGVLLSATIAMLVYQLAFGEQDKFAWSLLVFFFQVIVQMLSIVALKIKVMASFNRVTLLSRFATKVLLMHAGCLALRVVFSPLEGGALGDFTVNLATLAIACYVLSSIFGVRCSLASAAEHADVRNLAVVALILAFGEALIDKISWQSSLVQSNGVLFVAVWAAANHMQLLAFLPALWMLYKMDLEAFTPVEDQSLSTARHQAICFCSFLVGFYLYEDMLTPVFTLPSEQLYDPCMMGGYIVHLMMVLDFAGFFLFNAFDDNAPRGKGMTQFTSEQFNEI